MYFVYIIAQVASDGRAVADQSHNRVQEEIQIAAVSLGTVHSFNRLFCPSVTLYILLFTKIDC
jgi:hypothetical protein